MLQDFKSEIKLFVIVAIIAVIISVGGILLLQGVVRNQVSPTPAPTPSSGSNTLEGIVHFESLEGGCWYLQVPSSPGPLEDIEKYELLGVSEVVLDQYRDQQVTVKGNTREDMASICQIGTIFEVEEISSAAGTNQQPVIDTSTWQTYHSEIQFEYPEDWQIHFRQYAGGDHLLFSPILAGEPWGKVNVKDLIYLIIGENTQKLSLDAYITSLGSDGLLDIISVEDAMAGHTPGKKIFYRETAVGPYASVDEVHERIIILRQDKIYEWIPEELTDEGQAAWEQILATFRFVE